MTPKPEPLPNWYGKRFSCWQIVGRVRKRRVAARCRHCGLNRMFRRRDLTSGNYRPCPRCFNAKAGLLKDIASNPHTKYHPNNTKETHA